MREMTVKLRSGVMAVAMIAGSTTAAFAQEVLDIAWVHSNAAAQSEQRVKDGFQSWLTDAGYDWNVSYLDSQGSGEATASNLQDAVSRGVDAIIITMSDLRASKAAIDVAIEAGVPVFSVDSGYV